MISLPGFWPRNLIREKLLAKTYEELPYSIAVTAEEFIEEDALITIQAVILVERPKPKGDCHWQKRLDAESGGIRGPPGYGTTLWKKSLSLSVGASRGRLAKR